MKVIVRDKGSINEDISIQEDSYIVGTNEVDESSIVKWDSIAYGVVGRFYKVNDEKSIQREVDILALAITSNDIKANWDLLSADEKEIICKRSLSKVDELDFVAMHPDSSDRLKISNEYDLTNKKARELRYLAYKNYLFNKIGTANTLIFISDCISQNLIDLYSTGIEGTVENGIEGIVDIILGRSGTSYAQGQTIEGLIHRSYAVRDGSGDTISEVSTNCSLILTDGIY